MRGTVKKKNRLQPDRKYNSLKVAKLINYVMREGKKTTAEKIVYDSFKEIEQKEKKSPMLVFEEAIQNVGPLVELKSRRVGGASYQIPIEVNEERRLILALRWVLEATKSKKGESTYKKLAKQLIDASKNEGPAVVKRENIQKMAEANRAFAHLAW